MRRARGPTWEELRAWCGYGGQNFERLRDWLTNRAAAVEVKRTLDEMRRLAETKPTDRAEWVEHEKQWQANQRAHERALNIAFPRSDERTEP